MNALLTGGLVAAVIAAWSQVKAFASYLSSFVVVQADMDDYTSTILRRHLRRHWKLLPSGQVFFRIRYIQFNGRSESTRVPFKLPGTNMVYRNGTKFLLVRDNNDRLKVSHLRAFVNLEELIKEALVEQDAEMTADISNRFSVYSHVGRDKTMFGSSAGTSSGLGGVPSSEAALSVMPIIDSSVDKSFMYDSALWANSENAPSPFASLYYNQEIETYINQARNWLSRCDWYAERGIPWRRGWLLHGPGGTGKTSLARAVARELGIPIHQFYLSTLSDQEFIEAWNNMAIPCMVLLEDFDNVFNGREPVGKTSLTFDCVLNQISGVSSANGIFMVVTTNDISKIDPAMGVSFEGGISTRPGRIDSVIEVGNLDTKGRYKMAQRVLKDWPALIQPLVTKHPDVTPAQFQELCLQIALKQMQAEEQDEPTKRWLERNATEAAESFKYG